MKIKFFSIFNENLSSLKDLDEKEIDTLTVGDETVDLFGAYIDDERSEDVNLLDTRYSADISDDCVLFGYNESWDIIKAEVSSEDIKHGPIYIPVSEFDKVTNIQVVEEEIMIPEDEIIEPEEIIEDPTDSEESDPLPDESIEDSEEESTEE